MGFKDLSEIKLEYYTNEDNIVDDFYIPVLKQTVTYKRAVGFFSSNILLEVSVGLYDLAKNGGKIQLIIAPKLEKKDYEAIKSGYDLKDYVDNMMNDSFDENVDFFQKEDRFALLSYLIRKNILDIKVAYLEENNNKAMFHSKFGIMFDEEQNIISFAGSSNETHNGFFDNVEQIDVFCSWKSIESEERCNSKCLAFNRLWNTSGKSNGVVILPFPEVIKNKLIKYEENCHNHNFNDIDDILKKYLKEMKRKSLDKTPKITDGIKLYEYQTDAINNWKLNNYQGIFDMATGTGKTFTALGAITEIFNTKKRLIVIICCPYIHLVEQWSDEASLFNIDSIKCFGDYNDYEKRINRNFTKYKQKSLDFICLIVSNATFRTEKFQNLIKNYINETLIVVDEAHNFGSYELSKTLNEKYPYRLALSATLDRYGDENGTNLLYSFFGKKCIEYTLEDAIIQGKLTQYIYHPVIVSLDEDEWDEYIELSKKISKYHNISDFQNNQSLKNLLIKRARLIAGAKNKIDKLIEVIKPYKNENNLLIYCGAVKYGDYDYENCKDEKKQIELVIKKLYDTYKMKLRKFTSEEDYETRKLIKQAYINGDLQALVAIKCLDEGVNIPAIKTAFILASSTNPKEYIQRRGRVLRLYKGKKYAEIYDFITLPNGLNGVENSNTNIKNIGKNLARKELIRVVDFVNLAKNKSECNNIIDDIKSAYNLDIYTEEEDMYD